MTNREPIRAEVNSFVTAAREFVELCARADATWTSRDLCVESLSRLAEIYATSLRLPELPFVESPDPPEQIDSEQLAHNLVELPFQYYYQPLEPHNLEKKGDLAVGDLLDDFIDLHSDLAGGL